MPCSQYIINSVQLNMQWLKRAGLDDSFTLKEST